MYNTGLQLNVRYKIIPFDKGYHFEPFFKSKSPLIPDDVLSRFFWLRNKLSIDYCAFERQYSNYKTDEGFYNIPCPDIEGFYIGFNIVEGKMTTFIVKNQI